MKLCWRRIYTLNLDDTLESCPRPDTTQQRRFFNAQKDKVSDYENLKYLHIIHLNGAVESIENGLILSASDYYETLSGNIPAWYRQAGQDYIEYTPLFIGTELSEDILLAEVERARPKGSSYGRAFLVKPSSLPPMKERSLSVRGVIHVKCDFSTFVQWLLEFGDDLSVKSTIERLSDAPNPKTVGPLSADEIEYLSSVIPVHPGRKQALANTLDEIDRRKRGKAFLEGQPPDWILAASDIPVRLEAYEAIFQKINNYIKSRAPIVLIKGQAGAGKTTAAMAGLVRLGTETSGTELFEISRQAGKLVASIRTLLRVKSDVYPVVYLSDLFLYAGELPAVVDEFKGKVTFVSTVRSGEWQDNFVRHLGSQACVIDMPRFTNTDQPGLIQRLDQYVPAPDFATLTNDEKLRKLQRSKYQLLIALKDATSADGFDKIIEDEFEKLPDTDTRFAAILVGIPTIARVGIGYEMFWGAYHSRKRGKSLDEALRGLEGIVAQHNDGRYYARHELYVRHLIERVIPFRDFIEVSVALLREFAKFEVPVILNVNRMDAQLFKALLKYNFIFEIANLHGIKEDGLKIYQVFEVDFQLDGHFWLQYGLYLDKLGRLEESLDKLRKSVRAYPQNYFARHAYSRLQLRICYKASTLDVRKRNMIAEAVETLKTQDSRQHLDIDEYPMVTLANHHVPVLAKHGEKSDALGAAREYYERLKEIEEVSGDSRVKEAKEKMFKFVTTGRLETANKPRKPRGRKRIRR